MELSVATTEQQLYSESFPLDYGAEGESRLS